MGFGGGGGSSQQTPVPKDPTNNDAAEKAASTAPAAPAPTPVITLDQTNPDVLALIKQRASQAASARGRSFLSIPYAAPRSSGSSGISIPS